MQDWFKARNNWGAGIDTLSDAEAGRFAKALWAYTIRGEERELAGSERALYAIALMTLKQDEQVMADLSQKRAAAGSLGGKQTQANTSKTKQSEAKQANAPIKSKNKNTETDKEIDKNLSLGFEEFWDAYPRKTGKGEARKIWQKLRPNSELLQQILNAIKQQSTSDQWTKDNGQFIPYPSTWLNQQRWEDEGIIEPPKKPSKYDSIYAKVKIN